MVALRQPSVLPPKPPAPLQLRHHQVDEFLNRAERIDRRDMKPSLLTKSKYPLRGALKGTEGYTPEQAIGMLREAEGRLSQGEKIGKICFGLGSRGLPYASLRSAHGLAKVAGL
jgi:putative transposase